MSTNRRGSFRDLNAFFVFGALTVLLIHILGFFLAAQDDFPGNYNFEALSIILLRFGRSLFIFATGMLLFYWYKNKPIDWQKFWKKRWKNIILPYMAWTAIYTYFMYQTFDPGVLFPHFAHSLFTGSSFYHLYYIPLFIQLNLFFMLFKKPIERYLRLPLLSAVFVLQLVFYMAVNYLFTTASIDWDASVFLQAVQALYKYSNSHVYMYVFYFTLGAYAGLFVEKWRKITNKFWYGALILVLGISTYYIVSFLSGTLTYAEGLDIFAPLYFLYTSAIIFAFYPLSAFMGKLPVLGDRLAVVAKYNFAIYLLHPLVLFLLESYVIYRLNWPTSMLIIGLFAVTAPLSIFVFTSTLPSRWKRQRKEQPVFLKTPNV